MQIRGPMRQLLGHNCHWLTHYSVNAMNYSRSLCTVFTKPTRTVGGGAAAYHRSVIAHSSEVRYKSQSRNSRRAGPFHHGPLTELNVSLVWETSSTFIIKSRWIIICGLGLSKSTAQKLLT